VVVEGRESNSQNFSWASVLVPVLSFLAVVFAGALFLCLGFVLLMRRMARGSGALFRVQFINRGSANDGPPSVRMTRVLARPVKKKKAKSALASKRRGPAKASRILASSPGQDAASLPETHMLRQVFKQNLELREQIGELQAAG
jgi:hypothetical protein